MKSEITAYRHAHGQFKAAAFTVFAGVTAFLHFHFLHESVSSCSRLILGSFGLCRMDSLPPHVLLGMSLSSVSLTPRVLGVDLEEPASSFPPPSRRLKTDAYLCELLSYSDPAEKGCEGVLSELVLVRNLEGGSSLDRCRKPLLR